MENGNEDVVGWCETLMTRSRGSLSRLGMWGLIVVGELYFNWKFSRLLQHILMFAMRSIRALERARVVRDVGAMFSRTGVRALSFTI
jgi:hypothetical protein